MYRVCLNCGSDKTHVKDGLYPDWYKYKDGFICKKCSKRLIYNPKSREKRLQFRDKQITLNVNPRVGVCQWCGAVKGIDCKRTHIHHIQYHPEDPLRDTVELCVSCHMKI